MNAPAERVVGRLSIAASIGLVLMVVATAAYVGWPHVAGAIGVRPAPAPPAYVAGDQVDVPASWYDSSPRTLILFARASCAACEKAQPFLKSLVDRMHGRGAVVMAHPPGAPVDDREYARSLGVADQKIVVVGTVLRVRATPTLVLVDRSGRILGAWEGAGSPERQAEITNGIDAGLR